MFGKQQLKTSHNIKNNSRKPPRKKPRIKKLLMGANIGLLQVGLDNETSAVCMAVLWFGLECVTRNKVLKILFRNCINDGSRPAVYALQRECTNRLKVLCSKGKVLNVQVKRCRKASGKCNGVECK